LVFDELLMSSVYRTLQAIQVRTTINQLRNKISAYLLYQFLDN
jgi:hypothetical protein